MKLLGKKRHECPEWDYLEIDETCVEIQACLCYPHKAAGDKRYLVLDLETVGQKSYGRVCNQFDNNNYILMASLKEAEGAVEIQYNKNNYAAGITPGGIFFNTDLSDISLLVGQNFKFDLLWFWGWKPFREWLMAGGQVWDTQTVEYLIRGQISMYDKTDRMTGLSLDALAHKYGAPLKDDKVKEAISKGESILDIDPQTLINYAAGDAIATEIVFKGQLKEVKRLGLFPLVQVYMQHYLAVCEMEYNGMHIDIDKVDELIEVYEKRVEEIEGSLHPTQYGVVWPEKCKFNIASLEHLSAFFFGGDVKYIDDIGKFNEDGSPEIYKTGPRAGQQKTKKEKVIQTIKGLVEPITFERNKKGYYVVDDEVLCKLKNKDNPKYRNFVEIVPVIESYRGATKLLKTYLKNIKDYTIPDTKLLRTNFRTTTTKTGRLASSEPNLQNMPPEILEIFNSRWYPNGVLVEFDFKQQEIAVAAQLSNDSILIAEIVNQVDIYLANSNFLYDKPVEQVTKEERQQLKILMLSLFYGKHYKSMARDYGLTEDQCKQFVDRFYDKYTGVKLWHDVLYEDVERSSYPTSQHLFLTGDAIAHFPEEVTLVGKSVTFGNKWFPHYNRGIARFNWKDVPILFTYFPSTTIKNYPVQGTASTAVCTIVGAMVPWLLQNREKCRLINEVHDSVLFDIKKEYLEELIPEIKKRLEMGPELLYNTFKEEWKTPMLVEHKSGKTWSDIKG